MNWIVNNDNYICTMFITTRWCTKNYIVLIDNINIFEKRHLGQTVECVKTIISIIEKDKG